MHVSVYTLNIREKYVYIICDMWLRSIFLEDSSHEKSCDWFHCIESGKNLIMTHVSSTWSRRKKVLRMEDFFHYVFVTSTTSHTCNRTNHHPDKRTQGNIPCNEVERQIDKDQLETSQFENLIVRLVINGFWMTNEIIVFTKQQLIFSIVESTIKLQPCI